MVQVFINCWAVLACAIANMALGFLWYGPLFGKQWTTLMGWSKEQMEAGKAKMQKDGWKTYLLAFIGSVFMATVLKYNMVFAGAYLEISGFNLAFQVAFWSWIGFIAPVTLGSVLWEGKSWKLWLLLNSYYLIALVVMGSILVIWS